MRRNRRYLQGYAFANIELASQILEGRTEVDKDQLAAIRGLIAAAHHAMAVVDELVDESEQERKQLYDHLMSTLLPQLTEYFASLVPKPPNEDPFPNDGDAKH